MPTVFLDYDGTLHNSMCVYGPAFRAGYAQLVKEGLAAPREFSDDEISRWLGYSVEDMWANFMPELAERDWKRISRFIGDEMAALTAAGVAELYPHTREVLGRLVDEGYTLVFLSNCGPDYKRTHLEGMGLAPLFSGAYCSAEFPGLAKWQIYERVRDAYPEPHMMVGDRFHDIEVATRAGIASIGCTYGYGTPAELEAATTTIASIEELPEALHRVGA